MLVLTHLTGNATRRDTLFLKWNQFDTCVPRFDAAYNYDMSLVDNSNGSEIMTLTGRDCENRIMDKFRKALNGTKD